MKVLSKTTTTNVRKSSALPDVPIRRSVRLILVSMVAIAGSLLGNSALANRYVDSASGANVGICDVAASPCKTIEYAIANSIAGDTIELMSLTGAANVYRESGLNVPFDLRIRGISSSLSIIDGGAIDRVFTVNGGNLHLNEMTIQNGDANSLAGGGGQGGAVLVVNGNLTIRKSVLINNLAQQGGAIAAENTAGTVSILDSNLSSNHATASGGAIHCDACDGVYIARSTVLKSTSGAQGGAVYAVSTEVTTSFAELTDNNADEGGAIYAISSDVAIKNSELRDNEADQGDGGGVYSAGDLNIQRSTLAGNTAFNNGGGIHLFGDVSLTTSNSTYSGNEAFVGGGFSIVGNTGFAAPTVHVSNSTFVDNESTFTGAGPGHHINGTWTSFQLDNSILHLAPALQLTHPVCSGPVTTGAANLIDDTSCDYGGAAFNFGAASGLNHNPGGSFSSHT